MPARQSPSRPPTIEVLLPIHRVAAGLDHALRDILEQNLPDHAFRLTLIANGPDPDAHATADHLAAADPRTHAIHLETPSLAAALNHAIDATEAPYVARMDDDDRCHPDRLSIQLARLESSTDLAAVACAWRVTTPDGHTRETISPQTDPRSLRWSLLEANRIAHGSVLMKTGAIRDVGAYDTSLDKAQDYDLWLRLSRADAIAAVPETLYTYTIRDLDEPRASSIAQARTASTLLLREWALLAGGSPTHPKPVTDALAAVMLAEPDAIENAKRVIDALDPTPALLAARLWVTNHTDAHANTRRERAERALLDERLAQLAAEGATECWFWGAGTRGAWAARQAASRVRPPKIMGFIDDEPSTSTLEGLPVTTPENLPSGAFVLVTSDQHERVILDRANTQRRDARVITLFEDPPEDRRARRRATPTPSRSEDAIPRVRRAG